MNYRLPITALLVSLLACSGSDTNTQSPQSPEPAGLQSPEPPTAAPILPKQLESFDYAWKRIKETHWDLELVGASWDAARAELRPKIIAAKTDDEARAVIRELLKRLKQSHFELIAPRAKTDAPPQPADIGVDLRELEQGVVVLRLASDSPAKAAGLGPGALIRSVDGKDIAAVAAEKKDSKMETASRLLGGADKSTVVVGIEDKRGKRDVSITRTIAAPEMASLAGISVPIVYNSYWYSKKKKVGVVRLSVFADPTSISKKFKADVKRFQKAKGLILDLRGNPGGFGGMAMGIAGLLSTETGVLGTHIERDKKQKFVVNPQPGAFTGSVAVVVDGQCGSTCEILAAGLSDLGRAQTFGTSTAGAALPSLIEKLPSGDLLQFAIANYVLASGKTVEGDGVKPTSVVEIDPKALQNGTDNQLDAAVQWITTGKLR